MYTDNSTDNTNCTKQHQQRQQPQQHQTTPTAPAPPTAPTAPNAPTTPDKKKQEDLYGRLEDFLPLSTTSVLHPCAEFGNHFELLSSLFLKISLGHFGVFKILAKLRFVRIL